MTQDEIIEMAIQGYASTRDAIRWAMNQEQEQSEPVAWMHPDGRLWTFGRGLEKATFTIPLYTTLQQRPWVGLTDEEIGMAFRAVFPVGGVVFTNGTTEFAQTIERKLKERNT